VCIGLNQYVIMSFYKINIKCNVMKCEQMVLDLWDPISQLLVL